MYLYEENKISGDKNWHKSKIVMFAGQHIKINSFYNKTQFGMLLAIILVFFSLDIPQNHFKLISIPKLNYMRKHYRR